MQFSDSDKTIFEGMDGGSQELPRSFKQVTVSPGHEARSSVYIAQQTSIEEYTPGLNPLVNAAAHLLLEMVSLRAGGEGHTGAPIETERSEQDDDPNLEKLRNRLESEIRGFETRAMGYEIDNSHVLAARYLLCTALDESVSTSRIGAGGGWARQALLSTFHNETWGGEKFFQILERCMQQPARNLYLLELIYLLLSLGFEGRYKLQARGPIELESLREKIYRQIRLLRGEPSPDLCKKLPQGKYKNKIYAYVPLWLLTTLVAICLAVTFAGFAHILDNRAAPLLRQFAIHGSGDKELSK
jgi:type VI secretion system protein ImpK